MNESLEKFNKVFVESFSLQEADLENNPAYNQTPNWDSIGHMTMISALEETFGISLETDDIVNFSSYQKGLEIMAKYGFRLQ